MIDKSKFIDSRGRPLTQGLFLELGYNTEFAVYTLKEFDHEYEGVVYPSLKQLYLREEDPVEYTFANKYLYNWEQWQRMCENKALKPHIESWRFELELKLSSQAVKDIILMTEDEKSFQARKYVAERAWNKRGVGRPKKDNSERDEAINNRLNSEYGEDATRVLSLVRN